MNITQYYNILININMYHLLLGYLLGVFIAVFYVWCFDVYY